jgi:hypothetical protein
MKQRAKHSAPIDLPTLVKVVSVAFAIVSTAIAGAGAYYTIVARIDRIDERMAQQGTSLAKLTDAIGKIAEQALTAADLRQACLQMQIANKGWSCPFGGSEIKTLRLKGLGND